MADLIPMRCTNCGGALQVASGARFLTCAFCHTPFVVRTAGGVTVLEADVVEIQEGVDRIESRVAKLQSSGTRAEVLLQRVGLQAQLQRLENERDRLEEEKASHSMGCGVLTLVVTGLCLVGVGAGTRNRESLTTIGIVLVAAAVAYGYFGVALPRRAVNRKLKAVGQQIHGTSMELNALEA